MKRKLYYTPTLEDAATIGGRQSVGSWIAEWLGHAKQLSTSALDALKAAELRDLKPFLESVAGLRVSSEYASVGKQKRTEYANAAEELIVTIDDVTKRHALNDILKLC